VGKSEPVTIFELMAEKGKLAPELVRMRDLYSQGTAHFYKQDWAKAIEALLEAEKLEPFASFAKTTPSTELLKLCRDYRVNPPPRDWDGVNRLTSK